MPERLLLLLLLPLTLVILALPGGNAIKPALLLPLWLLGFGRISRREALLYALACLFFSLMNVLSLRQGLFAFRQPDWLGMPWWEFFMWGFYLLHAWRVLDGPAPRGQARWAWTLALLYCAAFGAIADARWLLAVSGTLLLLGLLLFHEPMDLIYTGYLVALGAAVEYSGVHSGLWAYPHPPTGGVPLWFVTLWGGVGLFLHRLVVPLLLAPPPSASRAAA